MLIEVDVLARLALDQSTSTSVPEVPFQIVKTLRLKVPYTKYRLCIYTHRQRLISNTERIDTLYVNFT